MTAMVRRVDGDLIDRLRWLGCSRIKWDHREDAKIFDGEVRVAGESSQPMVKLREVWESKTTWTSTFLEWCRVKPSMRNHLLFKILYLYPDFPYQGKFEGELPELKTSDSKQARILLQGSVKKAKISPKEEAKQEKPVKISPKRKRNNREEMIKKSLAAVIRNSTSPLRSSSNGHGSPERYPPAPTIAKDKENAQPGEMYESGRGMQVCWPNRTVSHHYYTVLNNTRRWKDNQRRLQHLRKLYAEIVGEYPMMAPVLWMKLREELPNFDIK